jgi:hypothetical protein
LHAVFLTGFILPAQAELDAVSGLPSGDPAVLSGISGDGNPASVAVNLANGFPLWYRDANGRKLQLCLDTALEVAPGVVVNPCEYEPPTAAPPSFPGNFGAEAIYWSTVALGNYVSSDGSNNAALLVLALGVDSLGRIVGEVELTNGEIQGVVWNADRTLAKNLGANTSVQAINDSSRMVGYNLALSGNDISSIWSVANILDMKSLAPKFSQAYGINAGNQVVGISGTQAFAALPQ